MNRTLQQATQLLVFGHVREMIYSSAMESIPDSLLCLIAKFIGSIGDIFDECHRELKIADGGLTLSVRSLSYNYPVGFGRRGICVTKRPQDERLRIQSHEWDIYIKTMPVEGKSFETANAMFIGLSTRKDVTPPTHQNINRFV